MYTWQEGRDCWGGYSKRRAHFKQNQIDMTVDRHKEAVISSKISVPTAPVTNLARVGLDEIVETAQDKRLILICAPAGYGKTTIMSQWADLLEKKGEKTAWLTLDSSDNDPGRLYFYLDLVLSNREIREVAGAEIDTDLIRGVSSAHASLLAALLEKPQAPKTIFIDDFESIQNPESQNLVELLQSQAPSGVKLIVATRTLPPWKLAKLKVTGSMLEIGPDQLRLQSSEIAEFHLLPIARTVSDAVFDRIVDVMEGWVAGVQLSLLAIKDQPRPEDFVARLLGRTGDINAFLTEEVFNSLEKSVQDFLLFTGILERFSAPLCEAMTNNTNGEDTINEMVRRGLFVQSLDQHNEWYRYHNIFKTYLQNRLLSQYTDQVEKLHEIAAKWFAENGQFEEGVYHAIEAGRQGLAAELLSRSIRTMVERGQLETVERYISNLDAEQIGSYPEILGGAAWAYTFLRRFDKLQEIMDQKSFASNADILTLRPLLSIFHDNLAAAYEQATENLSKIPETLAFNRGVLLNIIAYCLVARSKFEQATAQVARAKAYHQGAGSIFGQAYSDVIVALIDRAKGNIEEALRKLEMVENSNVAKSVAVGFHAELLYILDRLSEAEQILMRHFQLAVKNAPPDFVTLSFLIRARIAFARNKFDSAYSILEEGEHVGKKWPLPHMVSIMRWERVRFALMRDELEAALHFAPKNSDGKLAYSVKGKYLRLSDETTSEDIAAIRLQIYANPSHKLLANINREISVAEQKGRKWRALQLQVLYAIANNELGEREPALRAMNDAVEDGFKLGVVRTFLDEGDGVKSLLYQLTKNRVNDPHPQTDSIKKIDYLCRLLNEPKDSFINRLPNASPSLNITVNLTKRERQILNLLCQGLSNEQIGQKAYLSTNTIKWHLKRIYEKLGVKTRVEASAMARKILS